MDVSLFDLWLPILVSAVFVFIVSSIIHMCLPIHKGDYTKLSNEPNVLSAMRAEAVQPGDYMFPCAGSMKEMATPEMIEKLNQGPVGYLTVLPNGPMAIGKSLGQWFIYSLAIGVFVAYAASMGLKNDVDSLLVFRFTSAVAILGYGTAQVPNSIWKGVGWLTTAKYIVDGLAYGLATGGAFVWLWPYAS